MIYQYSLSKVSPLSDEMIFYTRSQVLYLSLHYCNKDFPKNLTPCMFQQGFSKSANFCMY